MTRAFGMTVKWSTRLDLATSGCCEIIVGIPKYFSTTSEAISGHCLTLMISISLLTLSASTAVGGSNESKGRASGSCLVAAFSIFVWIDQIFDSNQILARFDQMTRRKDLTHLDYSNLSFICKYLTDLTDLIDYKIRRPIDMF